MKKIMVVILLLSIVGLMVFSNLGVSIFIDLPSMLVILIFTLIPLIWSSSLKDIKIGIVLIMSDEDSFTTLQLNNAFDAFEMVRKALILASILATLVGAITILGFLDDLSKIGPPLAVMMLTILYATIITIFILPIQLKLKKAINKRIL